MNYLSSGLFIRWIHVLKSHLYRSVKNIQIVFLNIHDYYYVEHESHFERNAHVRTGPSVCAKTSSFFWAYIIIVQELLTLL